MIDARVGWGSGIGRVVANTVPRVGRLLPDVRFTLRTMAADADRAERAVAGLPNIAVEPLDVAPFSLAEQRIVPGASRGYDLTWFTNYFVPLGFRAPFVANVHDMLHQERALFPASPVKRTLSHLAFRHVGQRALGVFYLSRFTQREFERRYGTPQRPVVVSCGIDHDGWALFPPDSPPPKQPRLLVVAAAKLHKNFAIAIDAFSRARIADRWRMTIITPNDKLRSSINLPGMAAAGDRIEFAQGLSNDALRALYGETAIVLVPSYYEGFGLPLAEGLQAGAQCIASTAAALVEVGQGARLTFIDPDDRDGWVKAIEDECARFDAGGVSADERSANSRHALQYCWDKVAQRVASTIGDVIAR